MADKNNLQISVDEYQKILNTDPSSKVFAALAEGYRELGQIEKAENIARRGVAKHLQYAPGYVALGKVLIQKNIFDEAVYFLKKAVDLSPENLLAYQLLGEAYLKLKKPEEALKAHKMALFLNPQNERSKQVVKKLEQLSAIEFEEDIFKMAPLKKFDIKEPTDHVNPNKIQTSKHSFEFNKDNSLDRELSIIDALIVRKDFTVAKEKTLNLHSKHPNSVEILKRVELLGIEMTPEESSFLKRLPKREQYVIDRKIARLNMILKSIENQRNSII